MKRTLFLLFITFFICSCSKNESGAGNGKVTIKGTISAADVKKNSGQKAGEILSLADAKKVMVFRGSKYSISDIVNGSFAVTADAGTANALVFLDPNNKFIGVLCTEGLNVLPLVGLSDGDNTVIDLKTLTMPGDSIIPLHNPFGDEINISPEELESLKAVGSYYEALAKNIDADNNGELDILSNTEISVTFHFNISIGKMGIDNIPPTDITNENYWINYGIEFAGGTSLGPVSNSSTLTGPVGDEYNDIILWGFRNTPNSNQSFLISFNRQGITESGNPMGNTFLPFKKGIYTFTPYTGKDLTLHFSNVDVRDNLIIVSPTLKTDGNGKIVSVSFKYSRPDNSPINPENLISDFMLQFINTDNQQFLVVRPVPEHGFYKYPFPTPVDLSVFKGMDLFYYDLLGNYYNNNWMK